VTIGTGAEIVRSFTLIPTGDSVDILGAETLIKQTLPICTRQIAPDPDQMRIKDVRNNGRILKAGRSCLNFLGLMKGKGNKNRIHVPLGNGFRNAGEA